MTGSLRNRSSNRNKPNWEYHVFLGRDENGKIQRLTKSGFSTKAAAAEAMRLAMDEARKTPADPRTLAEYLPHWLKEHAERHCSPVTVQRYRELLDMIQETLGPVKLTDLTPLMVEAEMNRLLDSGGTRKKTLSPKTVRHVAGVLSSALSAAQRWGMIPSNPCSVIMRPKVPRREQEAIDHSQTQWLLNVARKSWVHPFLVVAVSTGCRRGELLALTWADIDLENRVMLVNKSLEQTKQGLRVKGTKSERARGFALPQQAIDALIAQRGRQAEHRAAFGADYRDDLNLVFSDVSGNYRQPDSVTAMVCRMAKRAGFPGFSLHNLRHSHGSQLLSAGIPVTVVSKRLGHSSPAVTMQIYAHALKDDEQQAAEKWEQAMSKASQQTVTKQ